MVPYNKPLPEPTPETKEFWDSLKQHSIRLQRCQDCKDFYFYPRPFCPNCYSSNVAWEAVSGRGKLETYVINHRPAPGFQDDAPYVIAVVALDEGPRLMTTIVNVAPEPENLPVDLPVEIVYDDVTDEVTLPKFQPTNA